MSWEDMFGDSWNPKNWDWGGIVEWSQGFREQGSSEGGNPPVDPSQTGNPFGMSSQTMLMVAAGIVVLYLLMRK